MEIKLKTNLYYLYIIITLIIINNAVTLTICFLFVLGVSMIVRSSIKFTHLFFKQQNTIVNRYFISSRISCIRNLFS